MNQPSSNIPIACVRLEGVFTPEVNKRRQEIWGTMESKTIGIDELETGYAMRFPLEDSLFLNLAEFITTERLCCPFLHFALELKPGAEEVNLQLTGSDGVKDFLSMELAPLGKQNRF